MFAACSRIRLATLLKWQIVQMLQQQCGARFQWQQRWMRPLLLPHSRILWNLMLTHATPMQRYIHIYIYAYLHQQHICATTPPLTILCNHCCAHCLVTCWQTAACAVWGAWRHGCPVFDSISNNSHLPTINDKGHLWFVKTLFALFIICCHTNLFINASATPVRDTCLKGC